MTGQILLTIIMLLCFIIPLLLHYHNEIVLFDDEPWEIVFSITFTISIIYLIIILGIFIANHWNTPIF